ncbi:hypothetical protein POM88_044878 [Heracleum sosnowskyi]|uniref:Protein kinase domain-containing protein n=1 Tax=Heracleum sosnowskyi TaxID=360622 RepID=A0AAD8H679_9APIA|nr:hypothetical protein POM88_044878 [Heracleum sosnowskyi]
MFGEHEAPMDIWSLGCIVFHMLTGKRSMWPNNCNVHDRVLGDMIANYQDWGLILTDDLSSNAKDFLRRCLMRNIEERWTADKLLKHPFITQISKTLPLSEAAQTQKIKGFQKIDAFSSSFVVPFIQGRGKSVICEATIIEDVVKKVLKTTVPALVELNMLKNLTGSAVAGALGGFNAHAANIVSGSAVFIATGQDPAQNIESSHCITMMEIVNNGMDIHISVTMPCIEIGTVGGGIQLASQSACLNLLGVKGEYPGAKSRLLATIIAGSVWHQLSLKAGLV